MQIVLRSIAIFMLACATAYAGPLDKPKSAEAREHLEKGNRLLNTREFEAAISEYKAGALVEDAPLFQYNIALSYRQLGKYEESIWFYERFISRAKPTGEMLDGINNLIDQMRSELELRAKTQAPTEPAPSFDASASKDTTASITATNSPTTWSPDWFAIGMISAGSVGVLVGGGLLWDASSLRSDADKSPAQSERDALYAKADTRMLVGEIVGGVGVAVLATGVIKLAIGRSGSSNNTAWNVGASSNSVFVIGSF